MPWRRHALPLSVLVFWLAAMGWLVTSEILPDRLHGVAAGYKALFSDGLMVADHWMKIAMRGRQIGYSHTQLEENEREATGRYRFENRTVLNLTVMGEPQAVRVSVRATLDALYHLQDFLFALSARSYSMTVHGQREKDGRYAVVLRSAGTTEKLTVEIPEDAILYSPLVELALRQLKPGRQVRLRTFNPVSLATEDMTVKALRTETIRLGSNQVPATALSVDCQGVSLLAWVDAEGRMIRQETPFGWTLEACTPEEAMAVARPDDASDDILAALAVPVTGSIPEARTRPALRLRLKGPPLDADSLASHRQAARSVSPTEVELNLSAERLPAQGAALGDVPSELKAFLEATAYVQAADPRLVAKAREIIGDAPDSLQAALRLHDWVHATVRKEPAISVPSALDVLTRLTGDCNEHTYLFVGLARAAGLPARILVGLTWHEGAFYYHAWPAVYVGRWVEMDPTFGQRAVDATHIRLLEGELRDQMKLLALVGRLSIDVLADGP